ncbi:hypothetical protein ILUMI_08712 [Ignelater luminosus]|uniref:Titin n=1 Tax=Ignelater luminosus TaxID=2038154 RepID=A0A8K0GGS1_IGNLU|nr:hypothetical protein ILUMI_08712 [Ignelater luminosus]
MGNTSVKPHPRSRRKKQVHWKAADRPSPPGKPQLVSESEITPDVVTIRWDPPRYDGGSPITGYLVEHRRYGSPHWVRATPLLVPFTELSLSGLEPGWRYQFRISAENAVGLSAPGELSELLTVTLQRSAITAPRFIEDLNDTVALENEKTEFVAQFIGQPAPKVCWFKDGFEIFSSRRIRIITENDKSVLTIHQSSLSDEGEIKCTATNRAGHASTKAILTLEAPPSIRLPRQYEDGLLFELGEAIRLKVSIAGRPTPLVFWSHNNESIKNDDRYEIESTDKYSSVRLADARRTDRGEYQVKAVNKLGEAVASFLVTVTDKPSPPGQARVAMTLGRSVTLSWSTPADDGGCKIGNYIVEYFRIGWDVWLKAATCRQLTTTIGDLIEGSEYKFRIKAESPYGVSEPSHESDVVFIPDPKRGILTPSARSKSQPRDIFSNEFAPVPAKRQPRSLSSTRAENVPKRTPTPVHFYEGGVPVRPARTKVKSPSITPEPSPVNNRRNVNADVLDKNIFDRSSMARDLAYGTPEMKIKQNEDDIAMYESERLNHPANIAVKSTVNVIHHQNSSPVNIKPRSPSPKLQKSASPPRMSSFVPYKNDNKPPLRQRSPSPQPFTSRRSPSPLRQLRRSSSPLPEIRRAPSPVPESKKSRSPLPENKRPTTNLQENRRFSNSIDENERSGRALSPIRFTRSRSRSPSPIGEIRHEAINPKYNIDSSRTRNSKNDHLSNSSEFMLVLLPENQRGRGSDSDIKFDFDENLVPPPMSLSAPELGAEPLFLEPLRISVSSTELLHEQFIQRFYQALEAEEAELEKRAQNNNEA